MPLTASQIRTAKPLPDKPSKLPDGGGLYLEVRRPARSCGSYRYRIAGKENRLCRRGVCPSPKRRTKEQTQSSANAGMLTLAERGQARRVPGAGKARHSPAHYRGKRRGWSNPPETNTFEAVAREWIARKSRAGHHTTAASRAIPRGGRFSPYVGNLPIRNVTAAHLLEIVRRVEGRGAETVALLVRQWASAIFRYAVATLRADIDPAAALRGAIHRPKVVHRKPMTRDQIKAFVKALDGYAGYRTTVIALRLMLLTFVRTVELRGALWDEIDLDRAEWRIPAERMKMREPHIVPLSRQAVELLRELHTHTGGRGMLFPNYRNPKTCMTATTLNRALERMGFNGKDSIGFSAHGFRATASTILNEIGFRPDVIERQLAHAERNKVRASYNRAEYLEERRAMMQQWADMVEEMAKDEGKVTPIKKAAA
jgi:integrase